MGSLWKDLRYSLRLLAKKPLFMTVAVLALSLGIGVNSAVFSVVNAVLLRSLPFADPERLMLVWETNAQAGGAKSAFSYPRFTALKEQSGAFEGLAAISNETFSLTGQERPEQIQGARVSGDLFKVLGVRPVLGRTSLVEEDRPGGAQVAVITYNLWKRRFNADPKVLEEPVQLDGVSVNVIGVLPPDFHFLSDRNEIWMPRAFEVSYFAPESVRLGAFYLTVVGRLKPGVSEAQARTELDVITSRYQQANPGNSDVINASTLEPLQEGMVGDIRRTLLVVMGTVVLVLLMACANVANLQLARASTRYKEFAVRTALGATQMNLARLLLTESVLLSLFGMVGGLVLAYWSIYLLVAVSPASIPRVGEVSLDAPVLLFTLFISLLTGIVFGLAPALHVSGSDLSESLKEGGGRGGTEASRTNRLRRLLIVTEVALAMVVLVGAGLLIESFRRLQNNRVGLNPENVLTMQVTLPKARYPEPAQQANFFNRLLQAVETLPGVQSAAAVSRVPLGGPGTGFQVNVEGTPSLGPGQTPRVPGRFVTPEYFRTLNIPVVTGRVFTPRDDDKAPKVVVVNEKMARHFWPDGNAVGKRLSYSTDKIVCEVVGVVGDTKFDVTDTEMKEEMYLPYAQRPRLTMTVLMRASGDPSSLIAAARNEVLNIDKDQPVSNVRTVEQVVDESIGLQRFTMTLLGAFAAVALVLAGVGVYGVMNYSVTQRTREIGIRVTLGAQPRHILLMVVRQGMLLALVGIALGLLAALALTRILSSLLFGVSATDPTIFALTSLFLAVIAFLACYIPARRATKIEPLIALHYE